MFKGSIFRIFLNTNFRKIMSAALKEMKELQKSNVFMKSPTEVENKIKVLIEGGYSKLQIVTDFDQTMTKQRNEDGRKPLTSFGLLHQCPSIPESYHIKDKKLYAKYRPIELDTEMSHSEKTKHMEDWWSQAHDLLVGFPLPPQEFDKVAENSGTSLRDGTLPMLKQLHELGVPVLVFSAGLGDSVVAVLRHNNVLYPNVKVISNFLKYREDGILDGMVGHIIHTLNKNEQSLKGTDYYDLVRERGNVILMGDTIGDAGMADGVPHCSVVLRIGFLYDKVQETLPSFMDAFDIVLVDDQTMDIVQAILKLISKT